MLYLHAWFALAVSNILLRIPCEADANLAKQVHANYLGKH